VGRHERIELQELETDQKTVAARPDVPDRAPRLAGVGRHDELEGVLTAHRERLVGLDKGAADAQIEDPAHLIERNAATQVTNDLEPLTVPTIAHIHVLSW
jgi:hypothetical protein